MFLSALFYEVKGLEPEGKYFLVRFIQHFGREESVGLGVKVLAKQFGLSDRQVTASLTELDKCGVMTFSSTPEGKGRPKRCYRLTDDFHKRLNKASAQPATLHEIAVGSLLKHENRKAAQASEKAEEQNEGLELLANARRKRQPGRLSIVNRLLLSVLLCRADRFGVVNDLGSSALCKITGLSKERLKNRVQCLIDQGLIRTSVPGATSSVLFAKMKSIYVLNLNHAELSGEGDGTSILICLTKDHSPDNVPQARNIHRNIAKLKRDPTLFGSLGDTHILRFFEGQQPSFFLLLQVMLEKYADHLLSGYWSDLARSSSMNQRIDAQDLRERIRKDFRPPVLLPNSDGECLKEFGEGHYAACMDELYGAAYDLAIWIKELLCQAREVPFETMDFVIVPQPMGRNYSALALLALPKSRDGWRGGLIVGKYAEGKVAPEYLSCESDIPLESRYRFGLLTQPGSKVKNP